MNTIHLLSDDPAVAFAAAEFARYARKMASKRLTVKRAAQYQPDQPGVWIGLSPDFAGEAGFPLEPSRWDDGYAIRQNGDTLSIAGTNGRSALFGVYAYFERLGARWVRPGPRGEVLPGLDGLPVAPIDVVERASYRHRGVCIEGATSVDHVLALIDWMAKHRMNAFFLQFRHAGAFWDRWYAHADNPYYGESEQLSDDQCYAYDDQVIAECHRRGMMVHRVGHGWTAAAVGLRPFGWQRTEEQVAPDLQRWLAELNGRRELHQGIPINTELCYSHGPAFEAVVNEVASYAQAHPEVDVLHFWLSDATNNKCECAGCASLSPADWYARLVNALSERLHALAPDQRFVFLSYFESWWAPEQTAIQSERGNAIFMFAPIARCYRHALDDPRCAADFAARRPALNHTAMPRDNRSYLRLLEPWRQAYPGDSFVFDYHLIWAVHAQLTDGPIAGIMHDDMRALRDLGLNGMVSCQVMRIFWPTGLPMVAMAETLWNRDVDWPAAGRRHLDALYGEDAAWVSDYLNELEARLFESAPHQGPILSADRPAQAEAVLEHLARNEAELEARWRRAEAPAQHESLSVLRHHNRFVSQLCEAHLGRRSLDDVKEWLLKSEKRIHPNLDVSFLMGQHFRNQ